MFHKVNLEKGGRQESGCSEMLNNGIGRNAAGPCEPKFHSDVSILSLLEAVHGC